MRRVQSTVLLLLLILVRSIASAECISYEDYLWNIGSASTPGWPWDLVVSGGYAYIAASDAGLQIVSIADPENPVVVANVATPHRANDVAVSDDMAYVVTWTSGQLIVIDVSAPESPVVTGVLQLPSYANKIAIAGDYALIAGDYGGLYVVSIASPSDPSIIAFVETDYPTADVTIDGSYAYVAAGGLLVLDISNPATPQVIGQAGDVFDDVVAVSNGVALVGGGLHQYPDLAAFDVSDPTAPSKLWEIDTPAEPTNISIAEGRAYIATYQSRVLVLDLADPGVPAPVAVLSAATSSSGVAFMAGLLYVTDWHSGLHVVLPELPPTIGSIDTWGSAIDVAVANSHIFIADVSGGMKVFDISDPTSPVLADSLAWDYPAVGIGVAGSHAYVGCGWFGDAGSLEIVDIVDPANLVPVGTLPFPAEFAMDIAIEGTIVYLANGRHGLQIVDAADPTAPRIVGELETPGDAVRVALSEAYALVADDVGGLQVIDVADPAEPRLVGSYDTDGAHARGIAASGNLACLTTTSSGPLTRGALIALDISDPTNPVELGTVAMGYEAGDLAIAGNLAYVSCGVFDGLKVVDLSNPVSPTVIGGGSGPAVAVDLSSEYVCLASAFSGLRILNLQCQDLTVVPDAASGAWNIPVEAFPNPFNPTTVLSFELPIAATVTLRIYDLAGRRVATLLEGSVRAPGHHSVDWLGRNDAGAPVPSGVYLARLVAAGRSAELKLTLLK